MAVAALNPSRAAGWQAELRLGFRAVERRTVLTERCRLGPLAVQRPFYPEGDVCHVYLLHPPGGVVGGDTLRIDVDVARGARALVTTPGATKFYRSAGATAKQFQTIRVATGAVMEWLPQENIYFPGSQVQTGTRVELEGDARLVLWELQCLGRPAIREVFDQGSIDNRLEVYRDGRPLVLERLRVDTNNRSYLSLMAGMAVTGMLLISHAGTEERDACRALLDTGGKDCTGVTLIDGMLSVRYLGHSTETARRLFSGIWERVREATVGRPPAPPRIWAT